MSKIKKIIIAGLLLATTIVFNRFLSIKTPILVISFTYLPIMLSGIMLGPWWSMLIAGLADLIGALLFPFGAYFVGYTITSLLTGFIYALFLQRKGNFNTKKFIINLIISSLIVLILCNSILNSLWIYITAKKAFFVIFPTRLLKQLIMLPIQVLSVFFINLGLDKMGVYKRLFNTEDKDNDVDENIDNTLDNPTESDKIDNSSDTDNAESQEDNLKTNTNDKI